MQMNWLINLLDKLFQNKVFYLSGKRENNGTYYSNNSYG